MSKYHEIVYGNYPKNNFNQKLVTYLSQTYKIKPFWSGLWNSEIYNNKLLEIGFGQGDCLREFEKRNLDVYGIDYNSIYTHKNFYNTEPTDFSKDKLPYDNDSFSFIFCKSVIEHIKDTDHFLSEVYRILKPGGTLIILTPAWEFNYKDFFNDYTHVRPFHRKGLQDALKIHNFRTKVVYHYHLPWLWEKPYLFPLVLFLRLFYRFKWKNSEENIHRVNIRFSQEVQLLAVAKKS